MLKKNLLLAVSAALIGLTTTSVVSAWPQPTANFTHVLVDNNLTLQIVTAITNMNSGTIMDSDPNPIGPGESRFQNEGNSWFPSGFTLAIGDSTNPSGQCIVKVDLLGGGVIQAGDGSNGFVCHSAGDHVILDPVSNKN